LRLVRHHSLRVSKSQLRPLCLSANSVVKMDREEVAAGTTADAKKRRLFPGGVCGKLLLQDNQAVGTVEMVLRMREAIW
jgi:hypothetical protein